MEDAPAVRPGQAERRAVQIEAQRDLSRELIHGFPALGQQDVAAQVEEPPQLVAPRHASRARSRATCERFPATRLTTTNAKNATQF